MPSEPPSFRQFIAIFTDFLTVAIHTIIYERQIYPATSFLSAKKYNYAVRQSRHPRVCRWITDAVAAAQTELLKSAVSRIAVVIYDVGTDKPVERFMFDVSRFPVVPIKEAETPMVRLDDTAGEGDHVNVLPIVDLEEQFRATMARLSGCGSRLGKVPKEGQWTFTVAIELKDESEPPLDHPQAWIPVQPGLQKTTSKTDDGEMEVQNGKELGGGRTVPVRSVAAGEMLFEMWIEEGNAKDGKDGYASSHEGQTGSFESLPY